ncbi:MAG TPA: dTDP-4-dehydrorhamnose 3,5-epimerase [Steroidobacteraceae bacterium]|nr:dTDP-4-dehydrorhamnose 3,5-epimerase [Steroidobacteraceae bacterium]
MEFEPTQIRDVVLIRPRIFSDPRGFFFESWEERKFAAAGIAAKFVQDNHSRSVRNTLRGLHYQIEQAQGKLVRVATGAVFDVVVDLRRRSPTFGKWVGVTLSEENRHMLWVPPGFAHGFLVLSESADFLYRVTDFWAPAHERTILWSDPDLDIGWPLPAGVTPLVSQKDGSAGRFHDADYYP